MCKCKQLRSQKELKSLWLGVHKLSHTATHSQQCSEQFSTKVMQRLQSLFISQHSNRNRTWLHSVLHTEHSTWLNEVWWSGQAFIWVAHLRQSLSSSQQSNRNRCEDVGSLHIWHVFSIISFGSSTKRFDFCYSYMIDYINIIDHFERLPDGEGAAICVCVCLSKLTGPVVDGDFTILCK